MNPLTIDNFLDDETKIEKSYRGLEEIDKRHLAKNLIVDVHIRCWGCFQEIKFQTKGTMFKKWNKPCGMYLAQNDLKGALCLACHKSSYMIMRQHIHTMRI